VIIIAHAKKDEDTKKSLPDVTGQSYQLILRIADQVGYISYVNNERNIQWSPTDLTVGKNTANLSAVTIPDKSDPALKTFMTDVIAQVKRSIVSMGESQAEAMKKSEALQLEIKDAEDVDDINLVLPGLQGLPKSLKDALIKLVSVKAKTLKLVWDKEAQIFVDPNPPAESKKAEKKNKPVLEFN